MDSGASGYLLKNATRKELLEAIELVFQGKEYFSHEASPALRDNAQQEIILTRREVEVLELIANGLTNNEIARTLFVSPTTVDTHRSHLLTKLQARNTAELVKKALTKNILSREE